MILKAFVVVCVFLVCIASKRADASCESSSRYVVEFFIRTNWYRASQICSYHGLQLASVQTREDSLELQDEIKKAGLQGESLWIGGNDWSSYKNFYWASNGRPISYSSWDTNQPDNANGNEHCVHVVSGGIRWNDNDCKKEFNFVCERVCK